MENIHIQYIKNFITQNTPIEFAFDIDKHNEIKTKLNNLNLSTQNKEIINAAYSLFYTSLGYHKKASENNPYQPYNILVADYISSYVTEILYQNKLFKILNVFAISSKHIMLNLLNDSDEDPLLDHLLTALEN